VKGGDAMRYGVIGGDVRFAHLVRLLVESGRDAQGFLQGGTAAVEEELAELHRCSVVISNWPMRWPLAKSGTREDEIMESIAPGSTLLLCGPGFPKNRRWDLEYINLWEDEELLQENAWLTAEGAAASAMQKTRTAMNDSRCMVVGYGRIGRALTEILLNLGAQVTVVSSKTGKRAAAMESGAKAVSLEEMLQTLPGQQIIFSTPPAMVIDRRALECVNRDAMLIDLASPPYGIDLEAAKELGLCAFREPGLPGRYCPLSAARALCNAVMRWEEAEAHEN